MRLWCKVLHRWTKIITKIEENCILYTYMKFHSNSSSGYKHITKLFQKYLHFHHFLHIWSKILHQNYAFKNKMCEINWEPLYIVYIENFIRIQLLVLLKYQHISKSSRFCAFGAEFCIEILPRWTKIIPQTKERCLLYMYKKFHYDLPRGYSDTDTNVAKKWIFARFYPFKTP